ncbi:unnamed protein product [Amoebophrya sp. A120]|nr:unnamed protein product [Amoebophrya sp. A120]|eukprot:GSA120T00025802001.1
MSEPVELYMRRQGYTPLRKIGKGSFGAVFLCNRDLQEVVCKMIDVSHMSTKERQKTLEEGRLLASLSHPYVCKYHGSHLSHGWFLLAMDYCPRGDLGRHIRRQAERRRRFSEKQVVSWLTQILLALHYLHAKKHILHRDVKSSNFFLTDDHSLRMGDFGISKCLGSTVDHARTQIGTPYYISPEICENKEYSFSADIWSLGCLAYELMVLKVPYDAPDVHALCRKIREYPAPTLPATFSSDLRCAINLMFCKDPRRRPRAEELLSRPVFALELQWMTEQNLPTGLDPELEDRILKKDRNAAADDQMDRRSGGNRNGASKSDSATGCTSSSTTASSSSSSSSKNKLVHAVLEQGAGDPPASSAAGSGGGLIFPTPRNKRWHQAAVHSVQDNKENQRPAAQLPSAGGAAAPGGASSTPRGPVSTPGRGGRPRGSAAAPPAGGVPPIKMNVVGREGGGSAVLSSASCEDSAGGASPPPSVVAYHQHQVGDLLEYWSDTHRQWVRTRVTDVDPVTNDIQIDAKPGSWLEAEVRRTKIRSPQKSSSPTQQSARCPVLVGGAGPGAAPIGAIKPANQQASNMKSQYSAHRSVVVAGDPRGARVHGHLPARRALGQRGGSYAVASGAGSVAAAAVGPPVPPWARRPTRLSQHNDRAAGIRVTPRIFTPR